MLEYALIQALFSTAQGKFTAKIQSSVSYSFEDIIDRMVENGSTLSREELVAAVRGYHQVIAGIIKKGGVIHTEAFQLRFSITGTFDDASEAFDPKKQAIHLHIIPGPLFQEAAQEAVPQKVSPHTQTGIVITEVKDSTTGSINANITSEGVVEIVGSYLKIEGNNPQVGVYFIAQDGTEHKVATLAQNKPSSLLVVAPTLTSGTYTLEIKTQYNSTPRGLVTLRSEVFNLPLTVV